MAKTISIPDEIYEKMEKRAKESDFKTADEYVEYVLKQIIERLEEEKEEPEEEAYSDEDEEKVKERLKALGYLE